MKLSQKLLIILVYSILFLFFFYNYFELTSSFDRSNYGILLVAYLICGITFLINIFKKNYYIFEPYTIVSLLYFAILICRPCIDIQNGIYYRHGVYVMNGCMKTTIIFIISFLLFSIAYNLKFKNKKMVNKNMNKNGERLGTNLDFFKSKYTNKVRIICIIFFLIGFVAAIIYYKTAGYNPLSFLKNIKQSDSTYLYNSNYKFLAKMPFMMIIPWLYITKFDKNKLLKLILTIIMFIIFLIAGSRYIIVISILAYIILPYISERKSFSFKKAFVLFSILLIVCDVLAYVRIGIRTGQSIDYNSVRQFVEITDVFDSDLTIYQPLYCVVEKIPSIMPYQLGKGLIGYSIVSFLPRFIFPWKSKFDIMAKVIQTTMNETAMKSGLAIPNIGEFYLEFGIIGCFICMIFFGIICSKLKELYTNDKYSINEIVLYSILFPFLMQLVCRGYLAVQLNSLLFLTIPYFVLRKYLK